MSTRCTVPGIKQSSAIVDRSWNQKEASKPFAGARHGANLVEGEAGRQSLGKHWTLTVSKILLGLLK